MHIAAGKEGTDLSTAIAAQPALQGVLKKTIRSCYANDKELFDALTRACRGEYTVTGAERKKLEGRSLLPEDQTTKDAVLEYAEPTELNNASTHPRIAVDVIMDILNTCLTEQPIPFFELVEKCRKPGHLLFGNSGDELKTRGLSPDDSLVKDIILSSVTGDDLAMTFGSPIGHDGPQRQVQESMMRLLAGLFGDDL